MTEAEIPKPPGEAPDTYYGCVIPDDRLYDVEYDTWIRIDGDVATIGMTDPAQTRCGKLVAVDFRRLGKQVRRGRGIATIESAKWVGPVPSPLSGEIIEVNAETFKRDILMANRDPYGEGWLVKLRLSNAEEERAKLLEWEQAFESYKQRIEENEIRCFRCADDPPEPMP